MTEVGISQECNIHSGKEDTKGYPMADEHRVSCRLIPPVWRHKPGEREVAARRIMWFSCCIPPHGINRWYYCLQLTCYFLPISPPRCSQSVLASVTDSRVRLIEPVVCSFGVGCFFTGRRPKSNLVTPITRRDTPPPSSPAPQGFVESFTLYAFEHLHSKPSPPPHVCLEGTESFPIICAQPQSLITPPVVWLFCLTQVSLQIVMFTLGRNSSGTQHGINATAVLFCFL